MSNDEFTKLFKYMQEFRAEVNDKLDTKADAKDVQKILNVLDSTIKRQEISDDERLVSCYGSSIRPS